VRVIALSIEDEQFSGNIIKASADSFVQKRHHRLNFESDLWNQVSYD
jgi:hypothetical protein